MILYALLHPDYGVFEAKIDLDSFTMCLVVKIGLGSQKPLIFGGQPGLVAP
jgi:hypothetical protein